ncbi:MAG: PorP/SprF family type IX secretion system membrane protein [Hymenobacteraceae bacterium]|nr:PorP/SprF family type IX secretion system membrane protein [Hymenobacteraceae bacterium]
MRKLILLVCCMAVAGGAFAQSRKHLANFSQYQQFYNPSLTGFEGPVLKTLYRNQWTGFEDAPKTMLASAELDLARLGQKKKAYQPGAKERNSGPISARHGLGLTVVHDQFGPARETQLQLSYGSGVRLSETLHMRWGTALTYTAQRLDGNSLTLDQENDPRYREVLGQNNRMGKVDLNLGLALTGPNFYLGYALLDITEGEVIATGDDYLKGFFSRKHVAQAGYRNSLTDELGFTLNGIYQHDDNLESTLEGQLKLVYQNTFWIGGGYRNDRAYTLAAGIRLHQLSIQYAYENPVQDARAIGRATNEIGIRYNLFSVKSAGMSRQLVFW